MSNGARQGMSLADYMNHSNRSGGKKSYLSGWKSKDPYAVTVWLSTRSSIYTLWRHGFQRVEPRENKETKEKTLEVWSNKLVCRETEENLKRMYWRDKNTGEREYPPEVCPHCLMIEDVYQRVHAGEIDWLEPLFKFEGTDPSKTVFLHAGGLYNAFGSKDLDADDKKAMAAVSKERGGPVYAKNAWKENNQPKMEYVYCVVNHEDVGAGVQIAIEASLLGDKMKTEIAKAMKRNGEEAGNPILHPYAFEWRYDPSDGIAFDKKYEVTALDKVRLTPAIEKLIRDTAPPDLTQLLDKFNLKSHRAALERYAFGVGKKLPFDSYFEKALAAEAEASRPEPARAAERAPEVGRQVPAPAPQRAAPPPVEEEIFGCDAKLADGRECGAEMKASETVCRACGARYDVQAEEPPPPPPKPVLPKRSTAAKAPPVIAKPATAPRGNLGAAAPPPEQNDFGGGYPGDPDDGIPFATNTILTSAWDESALQVHEVPTRFLPRM